MTTYKANTTVLSTVSFVYQAITQLSNYGKWLPENRVKKFEINGDEAILELQSLGTVQLAISEQSENRKVVISPIGKAPVEVQFELNLTEQEEENTGLEICLNAGLNPMMKIMAGKILERFVQDMAANIATDLRG